MRIFTAETKAEAFENINNENWKQKIIEKLFDIHNEWGGCLEFGSENPQKLDSKNVYEIFELDCADKKSPEFVDYQAMNNPHMTKLAKAFRELIASAYQDYAEILRGKLVKEYNDLANKYVTSRSSIRSNEEKKVIVRLDQIRDELGMDKINFQALMAQDQSLER